MESNWIGNTIQLIVIGFIAYLIIDFIKPFVSKGALVEKEAGHQYDESYRYYRSQGEDIHSAANSAYADVSPNKGKNVSNFGGHF